MHKWTAFDLFCTISIQRLKSVCVEWSLRKFVIFSLGVLYEKRFYHQHFLLFDIFSLVSKLLLCSQYRNRLFYCLKKEREIKFIQEIKSIFEDFLYSKIHLWKMTKFTNIEASGWISEKHWPEQIKYLLNRNGWSVI